nr:ARID DNA-binding domain-containing protein [Tanacetum cinerariifolium]
MTAPSTGKKNISTSGNSIKTASKTNILTSGQSSTLVGDKINQIEKHLMEGKYVLVDNDGKPLENVDSLEDHDSDDEVKFVDNDMARYFPSNLPRVGYDTKSQTEQWNDPYGNADYNYDPYDNDMYEGQKDPDNLHAICDNLNIKSKNPRKPLRRKVQQAFIQRHIKREKEERIGKCIKQITRDCKGMLRKKLEEIKTFNSSMPQHKYRKYNCFYCKQKGHIIKFCPIKIKDEAEYAQSLSDEAASKFTLDKSMIYASNAKDMDTLQIKKLEGQRKFLFTYGMGEVWIKNDSHTYLIPGVHYAPEITLNILSMNLLQQQGFEIIFEGDKCILEYMFKDKQGQNLDVDKMRQMHNNYLEDYFDSLDRERANKEGEMARAKDNINSSEVHTFYEFVAFLNLIKNDEIVNKGWDIYRERFDKVLKCVNFGQEFDVIAEILGLTKRDGEEIKRCYISYLDVFTSYYKTARAPQIPTKIEEDSESLVSYQWNTDRTCAPKAVQKGKEKLEHFGIKLEDETYCNIQQTTHYEQDKDTICKRPSTSRISDKEGPYGSTSDDYIIIT